MAVAARLGMRSSRRLTALILATAAITGCGARARIATGAATMLVGTAFAVTPGDTYTSSPTCHPGPCGPVIDTVFTHERTDHSGQLAGGLVLLAGAALVISGLLGLDNVEEPPPPATTQRILMQPTAPWEEPRPAPAYGVTDTAAEPGDEPAQPAALPAVVAIRSRMENRLAIQASLTARAGQCEAALVTAQKLAELDPELYSRLILSDDVLARCSTR